MIKIDTLPLYEKVVETVQTVFKRVLTEEEHSQLMKRYDNKGTFFLTEMFSEITPARMKLLVKSIYYELQDLLGNPKISRKDTNSWVDLGKYQDKKFRFQVRKEYRKPIHYELSLEVEIELETRTDNKTTNYGNRSCFELKIKHWIVNWDNISENMITRIAEEDLEFRISSKEFIPYKQFASFLTSAINQTTKKQNIKKSLETELARLRKEQEDIYNEIEGIECLLDSYK